MKTKLKMPNQSQLQHPDTIYLEAAAGWIELEDYDSANEELENIRADWREHPDILDLRCLIYAHYKQWDACLDIASAIVKLVPDRVWGWVHKAYAQRRATGGSIDKAKPVLEEAAKLFPDHDMIQYNLACYNAQLGHLDAAQEHLDKSCKLGNSQQIKLMAINDEDLRPLWKND